MGITKKDLIHDVRELEERGKISFDINSCENLMKYKGTISDVLGNLNGCFKKSDDEIVKNLFLYSNRLLSGIIDYGLKTNEDILNLKLDIEDFYLNVNHGNYSHAKSFLKDLKLKKSILNSKVIENADHISWAAFNPNLIKKLTQKICLSEKKLDYIVLDGHDAYRPGFMLANYFNINACAIRNAQDSGRDVKPRPLKGEEKYLGNMLNDKNILLMGEDVSTGNALKGLSKFVKEISHPKSIITASTIFIPGEEHMLINLDFFGERKNCFS